MKRVAISGIGFVHPFGIGKAADDLWFDRAAKPTAAALGGDNRMFHYDMGDLSAHPDYPNNKQLRTMREDAVFAHLAAGIALEDAGLTKWDHRHTALYTGAGLGYSDMWPALKQGISSSMDGDTFDIHHFGKTGRVKINPFFSIRSLSALPMATISEKFRIQGENSVWGSFGAESVGAVRAGVDDILSGRCDIALVGGLDFLSHPHKMESMYLNDFYSGDIYVASAACFLVLESLSHNQKRGGKCLAEIVGAETMPRPVFVGNRIDHRDTPIYSGLFDDADTSKVTHVIVNPSGTEANFKEETLAATKLFPNAVHLVPGIGCETLSAAAEPFGCAFAALFLPKGALAVSLSRSVCGMDGGVMISKGTSHA